MAETVTYPLFCTPQTGQLHLRNYDAGADQTRASDLGAISIELLAAGYDVTIATRNRHDQIDTIGYGWNHPTLHIIDANSLLGLTASLYESWARNDLPSALIIADLADIRTGPGSGHNDSDTIRWLRSATTGNISGLEQLTGLSYTGYLRRDSAPDNLSVLIAAGTRQRRNTTPTDTKSTMGGPALTHLADTITAIQATDPLGSTATHAANATTLKNHADIVATNTQISRTTPGRHPWTTAN